MLVTKADGSTEEFRPQKLKNSLRRAGAKKGEIGRIVEEVMRTMTEGMTTGEIYRKAFSMLQKSEYGAAARYSLRRALFGLGPTGFPFEDFLTKLFEEEGLTVKTRQIIKGKCATHEVDIAAFNDMGSFVAEAKFHSHPGIKSDLQTILYSYARYIDLQQRPSCAADKCGIDALHVVTNTKFTKAAIKYAECTGLTLLSWNYPKGATLQDRIEAQNLYPVTVLRGLSNKQKQNLLSSGVILCRDLVGSPRVLQRIGLAKQKAGTVLTEARQLCHSK